MFFFTVAKINIDHTLVKTAAWLSAPCPLRNSVFIPVFVLSQRMEVVLPGPVMAGDILHASANKGALRGSCSVSLRGREKQPMFCNRKPHSDASCWDASSHPFVF